MIVSLPSKRIDIIMFNTKSGSIEFKLFRS